MTKNAHVRLSPLSLWQSCAIIESFRKSLSELAGIFKANKGLGDLFLKNMNVSLLLKL